jgi:hypothetical protein
MTSLSSWVVACRPFCSGGIVHSTGRVRHRLHDYVSYLRLSGSGTNIRLVKSCSMLSYHNIYFNQISPFSSIFAETSATIGPSLLAYTARMCWCLPLSTHLVYPTVIMHFPLDMYNLIMRSAIVQNIHWAYTLKSTAGCGAKATDPPGSRLENY